MESKKEDIVNLNRDNDSEKQKSPAPFLRKTTLATSKFYMGSIMSFLAIGDETDGRLAVMEYQAKPGNEPPPHIHEWEHEIFYVLEGVLEFYCDGQVLIARPTDFVFIPQGMAHAFYIRSAFVRVFISIQAASPHAVGLDRYFLEMSEPAESLSLPEEAVTYVMDDPAHAVRTGAEHGTLILNPAQTAELLPHFAGFGVPRDLITD